MPAIRWWCAAAIWCFAATVVGRENGDVRFYNLEKEYRATVTWRYRVRNTEALELKHIVHDMLSIHGVVYVNTRTNELYITDVAEKIEDLKRHVPALDVRGMVSGDHLESRVVHLKHESAPDIVPIIRHKLSPEGRVYEVPYLNAVTITDIPSTIAEIELLLEALDVPAQHVSMDVTIVEYNGERFSRAGVNVFAWLQELSIKGIINLKNAPEEKGDGAIIRATARPWQNQIVNKTAVPAGRVQIGVEGTVSDIVNFLCEHGDGAVLANTTIIARNNKQARIVAQERIPVRFRDSGEEHKDEPVATAGLNVVFVATVQSDSMINLKITPHFSDLTGWSPEGRPIIFERLLQTEVKVRDGAVFVLGGLKKREVVTVRRGVPGLKNIPVLKYLFSVKQALTMEREVLIFVKPTTDVPTGFHEKRVEEHLKKGDRILEGAR